MSQKADLSILEPFLSLERLEWGDIVRFADDILGMGFVPEASEHFRRLLKDLELSLGKPLILRSTPRSFSPEQCDAAVRRLGDWVTQNKVGDSSSMLFCAVPVTREENAFGELISWLRLVKRPTIMVFQGEVALSFLGIGLACDCRIATCDTAFHNHTRTCDMPPGLGLLYLLPAYVGLGRASTLVTRTTETSAHLALQWGLLDEVVPPEELDHTLPMLARQTSHFSAETLDAIRQLLNLHLPDCEGYFAAEAQGLKRALRGKPWEKLSRKDTTDFGSSAGL